MGIIGGLVAVAIAIWFYRTAIELNDPKPFVWAVNGVIAYYIVVFLWQFLVFKPAIPALHHQSPGFLTLIHLAGTVIGALVAWFVRSRWIASSRRSKES